MTGATESLTADSRLKRVEVLTSDGLRWEAEALSASDFDQRLYERRILKVKPPGGTDDSWRIRTSHVVAFRLESE